MLQDQEIKDWWICMYSNGASNSWEVDQTIDKLRVPSIGDGLNYQAEAVVTWTISRLGGLTWCRSSTKILNPQVILITLRFFLIKLFGDALVRRRSHTVLARVMKDG